MKAALRRPGLLLGPLGATKDKTFVVILDACRNDPFGGGYRPQQKGLSPSTRRVGSLLAYAAAPGNVAARGGWPRTACTPRTWCASSRVRGARIEDALKRVRLNVRLTSQRAPDSMGDDLAGGRCLHLRRAPQETVRGRARKADRGGPGPMGAHQSRRSKVERLGRLPAQLPEWPLRGNRPGAARAGCWRRRKSRPSPAPSHPVPCRPRVPGATAGTSVATLPADAARDDTGKGPPAVGARPAGMRGAARDRACVRRDGGLHCWSHPPIPTRRVTIRLAATTLSETGRPSTNRIS